MDRRVIVGREAELERIDALVGTARTAAGGALVLRGEAGIGKTALLGAARERAHDLRVLAVCGVETEANLPFAALARLVEPLLGLRGGLPAPQAAALDGALALGPPAPGDRFAVCVATLGLLRAAAAEGPLLALVDDAQWLDPASAECLAFVARRVGESRLALLFAVRDGEHRSSHVAGPADLADLADLPVLELPPIADDVARALLAAAAPDLTSGVCDAVVRVAAGNPLALVEVPASLTREERSGDSPLPEPLKPGGRIGSVFERRVATLGADARAALLVAAAAGGGDVATIWRACAAAATEGRAVDGRAIEEAEAAGLVRLVSGRLEFAHPLVRSAAYHGAPAPERRRAHRALAASVGGERRAWHLAAAAPGPDEEAATALEAAGAAAEGRRGHAEAAAAWERAAELSADDERRTRRLLHACNARVVAGQMERALALLESAIAVGTRTGRDPGLLHTRSLLLIGTGRFAAGFSLLRDLAEAASGAVDPAIAAFLLADTAMAALIAGDCRAVRSFAERGATLVGDAGDARVRAHVLASLIAGRVFGGDGAQARAGLAELESLVARLDPLDWATGLRTHALAIHVCIALEEHERARAIAQAALAVLDEAGAVGARANPLSHAADAAYRLGAWDVAWRESAEAILLAEETRTDETLVRALVTRARLAAARGLDADAREQAERATAIATACGIGTIPPYARAALGFLELGLGRVDAAIERLEPLREAITEVHGVVHPSIIPWRPDLCEAYVMTGRLDEGEAQAAALEAEAAALGGAAGSALAARCRGLLATDFDRHFEAALELDRVRPMPFERARTLLAWGARLHRARRRAEARRVLREADGIFTTLQALPWCERTAGELRAAGAVRRAARTSGRDELTAQEVRVASVVARGLTIREAGAKLFLSPKTIDFHLQQIYGKLGIRSRAQLAVVAVERGWIQAGEAESAGSSGA